MNTENIFSNTGEILGTIINYQVLWQPDTWGLLSNALLMFCKRTFTLNLSFQIC